MSSRKFLFYSLLCPKRFVGFLAVATYCECVCFFCKKKKVKNSFTLSYYFGVFIQLTSKMPVVSLDVKEQKCLGQNILWAVFFDKTGEECIATICLLQIALSGK